MAGWHFFAAGKDKKLIIISVCVAVALTVSMIIVFFTWFHQQPSHIQRQSTEDSVTDITTQTIWIEHDTTQLNKEISASSVTLPEQETTVEIPETSSGTEKLTEQTPAQLENALSLIGADTSVLNGSQLIIVDSGQNGETVATVSLYQSNDGSWQSAKGFSEMHAFIGADGVGEASEGLSVTPMGLFGIATAFGFDQSVDTGLDYFQITEDTYWVDDPDSQYYNRHVEGTDKMDWQSAEHMIDFPDNYCYGFVFDYNTNPVVPGKGSAFFMHVSDHTTHGCVAVSKENMKQILQWLQADASPQILII